LALVYFKKNFDVYAFDGLFVLKRISIHSTKIMFILGMQLFTIAIIYKYPLNSLYMMDLLKKEIHQN